MIRRLIILLLIIIDLTVNSSEWALSTFSPRETGSYFLPQTFDYTE